MRAANKNLQDMKMAPVLSTLPTKLVLALALRAGVRPRADRSSLAIVRGAKAAAFEHIKRRAPELFEQARSTFRDWGSERTSYSSHVLEMALAHTIKQ